MSRLLDPSFKWIPSREHDADSRPFRERQMARIKAANEARVLAKPRVLGPNDVRGESPVAWATALLRQQRKATNG